MNDDPPRFTPVSRAAFSDSVLATVVWSQHLTIGNLKVSVEDFLRHICLLTDKRMPTIQIPNTIALLAGQTNGYVNRFIGRDTWFTASSLRTLWSNSGISSVLAEKALNFTSRPWQSSITAQLDDLYRSF